MKIFFVGICGVSMSALAHLSFKNGDEVKGSDRNYLTPPKCLDGICVFNQPSFEGIEWADLIVYSSAINNNCEELEYAKMIARKTISRGEFLGIVSKRYEKVIAVAGSHGKTTTTAMIFHVLQMAGKNPTLHLGGILKRINSNVYIGGNELFVTEACEYCDNFLFLKPHIGVITNIEPEHLDYFKTFENEKKSYRKFSQNCEKGAFLNTFTPKNIKIDDGGRVSFSIYENGKKLFRIRLKIGGGYNAKNACICFEVCRMLGLSCCQIRQGLESFTGVKKRCENIDSRYPFRLFVDYGHHPKEVLESGKYFTSITTGKTIVVFQPHTYSRTKNFYNQFIESLMIFDEIICYKTYPAREVESDGLCEKDLSIGLCKAGKVSYICEDENMLERMLERYGEKDVVVFLGAGDLPEKFRYN